MQQRQANQAFFEKSRAIGSTAANPSRSAKPLTIPVSPKMRGKVRKLSRHSWQTLHHHDHPRRSTTSRRRLNSVHAFLLALSYAPQPHPPELPEPQLHRPTTNSRAKPVSGV